MVQCISMKHKQKITNLRAILCPVASLELDYKTGIKILVVFYLTLLLALLTRVLYKNV